MSNWIDRRTGKSFAPPASWTRGRANCEAALAARLTTDPITDPPSYRLGWLDRSAACQTGSPAQADAARRNGCKGGRPRLRKTDNGSTLLRNRK